MKRTTISILFASLVVACVRTEEGIDTTVIRGNIVVPPFATTEPADATNDSWLTPVELPMLSYREMTVTAQAENFGNVEDGVAGQSDLFTVVAGDDGTISFEVDFETGQGVGRDKTHMAVNFYDMDNAEEDCTTSYSCAPVEDDCGCTATYNETAAECVEDKGCVDVCTWEIVETETCVPIPFFAGTTDGTLGDFDTSLSIVDGTTYGIEIVATDSTDVTEPGDTLDYTFRFGALEPVDDQFLVGAYLADEVTARGNPVGGASVVDLAWDEVERAWVGKFEMLHIKSVETTPGGEGESDEHAVTESHAQVWLLGGSWPTLNASIPSGALYSSEAVQVATGDGDDVVGDWGDTAVPEPEELDSGDTAGPEPVPVPRGDIVLYIDALQPKVIGWEYTEEEPNDVTLNDDVTLLAEELPLANELPPGSLDIYTDVIHGAVELETADAGWGIHPMDVFAFTVESETNATFTFEWDDPSADHDFLLYDADGLYWAYSLYDYPEIIDTAAWGFTLPADTVWYIGILPYEGQPGDTPYTIEIEYAAP